MTITSSPTRRPRRTATALTALLAIGTFGLAACSDGAAPNAARANRDPTPSTTTPIVTTPTAGISGDAAAIVFMREEEKLARDVYTVLGDAWNLPTFTNITASEQQHMDAVATLLERAGIPDPAADAALGEFRDPDLQALYDDLIARGLTSSEEALRVGVLVEETDIADLAARTSDDPVVQAVWDRLTAGSEQHLRAFSAALARRVA